MRVIAPHSPLPPPPFVIAAAEKNTTLANQQYFRSLCEGVMQEKLAELDKLAEAESVLGGGEDAPLAAGGGGGCVVC